MLTIRLFKRHVDDLHRIADKIAAWRKTTLRLTNNHGEIEHVNDVFAMRTFCWYEREIHKDQCPPNFEHFKSGLAFRWYKHANRGHEVAKRPKLEEWNNIVEECLNSIPDKPCRHKKIYKPHWAKKMPPYWECRCGAYGFGKLQCK